jgi:GNAT superfamily N-acetyltransferase
MQPELRIEWGTGAPSAAFHAAAPIGSESETPGADASWAVGYAGDQPFARLATYIRHDLTGAPGASGLIGHYASRDAASGPRLLMAAVAGLREQGVARVLGPMNGSTWARYRLALLPRPGDPDEPPFLGEPVNPSGYPAHFTMAGFRPVASYESRISYALGMANPRAAEGEAAVAARGIMIAGLDAARFDDELRDLHALSVRAFPENLYYSPIDATEFDALYRPMRELIDPGLVLLARAADGRLVAYVFAYVDPLGRRGGQPYRLIVKTLATDPEWRGIGLGGVLVDRLHSAARARGLGATVHALMHVANNSVKISAHTAQVFRRYALYEYSGGHGR